MRRGPPGLAASPPGLVRIHARPAAAAAGHPLPGAAAFCAGSWHASHPCFRLCSWPAAGPLLAAGTLPCLPVSRGAGKHIHCAPGRLHPKSRVPAPGLGPSRLPAPKRPGVPLDCAASDADRRVADAARLHETPSAARVFCVVSARDRPRGWPPFPGAAAACGPVAGAHATPRPPTRHRLCTPARRFPHPQCLNVRL